MRNQISVAAVIAGISGPILRVTQISCNFVLCAVERLCGRQTAVRLASPVVHKLWQAWWRIEGTIAESERKRYESMAHVLSRGKDMVTPQKHYDGIAVNAHYTIDRETGLPQFVDRFPPWVFQLRSYAYDHVIEEDGGLSPVFWCGYQRRSPGHPVAEEVLKGWLARYERRPLRVLDVGTGTCSTILDLESLLSEGTEFYGCDLSAIQLCVGLHKLARAKVSAHLSICDAQSLPYVDNWFDLVTNFGSIMQLPSLSAGLKEMLRVAKPGALCMCRDEAVHPQTLLPPLYEAWFASFVKDSPPVTLLPERGVNSHVRWLNAINFLWSFEKSTTEEFTM
jgi:SAM-dependent methyltransferase